MNLHLNDDQIDELLQSGRDGAPNDDAWSHLDHCASCQTQMRAHQEAIELLALLTPNHVGAPNPHCPPDSVWLPIAAGIANRDSASHLDHAAYCDFCGPLLAEAVADFCEATSPEEADAIEHLATSAQAGQSQLVRQLQAGVPRSSWRRLTPVWSFAAGILVAATGFWGISSYLRAASPQKLLAQAYAENRNLAMRIDGAPYVPLSQNKGAGFPAARYRPTLSKARSEIDKHLSDHPDDVVWLQADGRADLLEGHTEDAVNSLEKAERLAPGNQGLQLDLATAYYQLNTPEDIGKSVDILERLVNVDPKNEVVRFNYAVALQQMGLYHQAAIAWKQFLQTYPKSDWAPDARSLLERIPGNDGQGQLHDSPGIPAAASIAKIDLDTALRGWLPLVAASRGPALMALANTLAAKHHDTWLQDLLRVDATSADFKQGLERTGQARDFITAADNDRAMQAASEAAALFAHAHATPGVLYAQFELVYADQLSHHNAACAAAAGSLLREPQLKSYAWLHIQAEIEAAICASLADKSAFAHLRTASQLAAEDDYPVLASRANQILSSLTWINGDTRQGWAITADGLRQYWASDLPPLRGYNLLSNLDYFAEDKQLWGLQSAVLQEAIPMISPDRDKALLGFEQVRLGKTLFLLGELDQARNQFNQAQQNFQSVPNGSRLQGLTAEAAIGLAEIDLGRGLPGTAVNRLGAMQKTVTASADDDLALHYYQAYGTALFAQGDMEAASTNLDAAVALAQKGLGMVHNERERFAWTRRNESTYRAMVQLKLRTAPVTAMAYWESYRGASLLPGHAPGGPLVSPLPVHDEALVSYFVSPRGLDVWIAGTNEIYEHRLPISLVDLKTLALRFSEECANPHSNLTSLRRDGLILYRQVFLPIEPLLGKNHKLALEPDGDLALIPFSALVDESGRYLGDRYDITISPGLRYLEASHAAVPLSPNSSAVVVGDPAATGWASLPDAELEARLVADQFHAAKLLLRSDATYDHIAAAIGRAEIFHFSGHGEVTRASAGVVVGGADLLDAVGLDKLNLRHLQLVVLSACISAHGSSGSFDDEDSMPRFLLAAGVGEVVASRWMVDSAATYELMKSFYPLLLSGKTAQESLDGAARAVRSQPSFAHPYYWAGFTTFGNT